MIGPLDPNHVKEKIETIKYKFLRIQSMKNASHFWNTFLPTVHKRLQWFQTIYGTFASIWSLEILFYRVKQHIELALVAYCSKSSRLENIVTSSKYIINQRSRKARVTSYYYFDDVTLIWSIEKLGEFAVKAQPIVNW